MLHIDKTVKQKEAVAIIDNLLNDCWIVTKYSEANYSTLSKPKYRKPFVEILLQEQKGLCCYCMKILSNDHHTTLEHIAPHHCTALEFDKYTAVEITKHVTHISGFNYYDHIVSPPKYPHDIAYHNLLVCCKDCNNTRDITFIRQFVYDPNITIEIEYDKQGIAYSFKYNDELSIVGISTNPNLILYRNLWALFAESKANASEVTYEDIENKILEMVGSTGDEKLLENLFGTPSQKDELLKYKWFFDYYKNNN